MKDIRYVARSLARKPAFVAVSVVILALAIGGATGIFTLIRGILLLPPAGIGSPEGLVGLGRSVNGSVRSSFSYPDFDDFRDSSDVFAGVAAGSGLLLDFHPGDEPERLQGMIVSGSYFSVLEVDLPLGRGFLPEETRSPDGELVVVLSHAMWRDRLGADPGVLGTAVRLNGHPFTVVGVAPEGFRGFQALELSPELWVPLSTLPVSMPVSWEPLTSRGDTWLALAARLAPGVSLERAQASVDVLVARLLEAHYPGLDADVRVVLNPHFSLPASARRTIARILTMLMAVVGLVLAIACANLASLLLARAADRRREMGIRLALGASRARLLRLLMTESVLVATAGGVLGFLVSGWVVRYVLATAPRSLSVDPRPDLAVLGFALALSVASGLVFGLAPALHASRGDVTPALREGLTAAGRPLLLGRSLLVVGQVALSVVLLVAAGLFVRGLASLQSIDPGFDAEGLVQASVDLRPQGYGQEQALSFYRELLQGTGSSPLVSSTTMALALPTRGWQRSGELFVEGREPKDGIGRFETGYNVVGPDYFRTVGIPLLRGRDFTFDDRHGAPEVAIVNESFARLVWPGEDPLGKRISRYGGELRIEVVGVSRDAREYGLTEAPQPYFYRPALQRYETQMTILARPMGAPEPVIGVLKERVREANPNLPVYNVGTLDELVGASSAPLRTNASLTGLFGVLALVLAAVGLYGLVAFTVAQRTREIGIRLALGAGGRSVVRLVLARGAVMVGAGLASGIVLAAGATRFLRGMLHDVDPGDPAAYVAAAAVLGSVALFACYLPARRAGRVDPVEVLRAE